MKNLRAIVAIIVIAMVLIGNMIEGIAHAGADVCIGAHCHDHLLSHEAEGDAHSHESKQALHECCEQIFCQLVVLSDFPNVMYPLGFQSVFPLPIGRLATINRPAALERPPNSWITAARFV